MLDKENLSIKLSTPLAEYVKADKKLRLDDFKPEKNILMNLFKKDNKKITQKDVDSGEYIVKNFDKPITTLNLNDLIKEPVVDPEIAQVIKQPEIQIPI